MYKLSSKPTRTWPPIAMACAASGNSCRPIPVAVHVEPAGMRLTIHKRLSMDADAHPGTPRTKLNCIGAPGTCPLEAKCKAVSRCPISKHSYSGLMLFSIIRLPKSRIIGMVFSNTSSPKLQVPQSSVAISGNSSVGCRRSSAVIPTAPPVEGSKITSGRSFLMASIHTRKRSLLCVGVPSSSRTCTCTTAAPAS